MAVIYMPKNVNPWEQMLPHMMSNMILSEMQDKYREKQEERQAERQGKLLKLREEIIEQQKPTDVPEGMFAYRGPEGWHVTSKPKAEKTPFNEMLFRNYGIIEAGGDLLQLEPAQDGLRARPLHIKPETMSKAIQEYELSKQQGFKGSFLQWKEQVAKAGATQVNVGDIMTKEAAKARASINTPEWRASIDKAVSTNPANRYATPAELRTAKRTQALSEIQAVYPQNQVKFGEKDGILGFYLDTGELISRWVD